jgi:TonB family protein
MYRLFSALIATLLVLPLRAQEGNRSTETIQNEATNPDKPTSPSSLDSTGLEVTHTVLPAYPLDAAKDKLQGHVTVKASVSETGAVDNAIVSSGDALLGQAAADAVKEWRFKPFLRSGLARRVFADLSFDFVYRGAVDDAGAKSAVSSSEPPISEGQGMYVVWIDKEVARKLKVKEVKPVYPPIAKAAGVQGNVVLFAVIGTDGAVRRVDKISGHPLLAQAAIDAVRQWHYKPYVLNGGAVPVQTEITVTFFFM